MIGRRVKLPMRAGGGTGVIRDVQANLCFVDREISEEDKGWEGLRERSGYRNLVGSPSRDTTVQGVMLAARHNWIKASGARGRATMPKPPQSPSPAPWASVANR